MSSPKIRDDLVRRLNQLARRKGLSVTKLVNLYVEACVNHEEQMMARDQTVVQELEAVLVRAILKGDDDGTSGIESRFPHDQGTGHDGAGAHTLRPDGRAHAD